MVAEKFKVDLNKPLVSQVGHLGDDYEEWIHKPIVTKDSPRFFGNPILEFLTKTVWWAIPAIWLPVVTWLANTSYKTYNLPLPQVIATLIGGVCFWTLMEYTLHRFLFHIKLSGYWGNTIHYLLHGCHHKHPMDGLRLVFPPAATTIILFPLWSLVKLLVPPAYRHAALGGGLLGYVIYDCTHYYVHHGKPTKGVTSFLKRYHMNHHFKVHEMGFGITSTFWDKIFGTLPPQSNHKRS